jgi:D-glycero-D-manno-heptose 1,7-bisphosphate phosphatase
VSGRAVFLDKDGTLIEDIPYNVDLARIRLTPGVDVALARLSHAGFRIVVVSNQPGVAYGRFSEEALVDVEKRLRELLAIRGVPLDGFYYCPHHPEATVARYRRRCGCRKPAPELIRRAAVELRVNLRESWLIGDILDDVEAGHRAGARAVLYDAGGETEWIQAPLRKPDFVAHRFSAIADFVLGEQEIVA